MVEIVFIFKFGLGGPDLSSLLRQLKGISLNETIELLRTKGLACGGYASYASYASYLHVTYDESTLGRALPEPTDIVL